jgi:deoxyribose-phosphate aldolase
LNTEQINEIVRRVTQEVLERVSGDSGQSVSKDYPPASLAAFIDHTLLKKDATVEEVRQICDEAKKHKFASVCVNPSYIRFAAEQLEGSSVIPCCVIAFPFGTQTPEAKKAEALDAIQNGAKEIDMVINIGAIKSKDWLLVKRDVEAVVDAAKGKAGVKVILETGLLTDEEKVRACAVCKMAGADFVKTCTGFADGSATVEDIELMRKTVGPDMGVKASGGIRTYETAISMIKAGATRLGASAGIAIISGPSGDSGGQCLKCSACSTKCPTGNCNIVRVAY